MKEELWAIFYVIFIIGAFLVFLSGGSISFLVLSLIFLPIVFIEMYRLKKLSFKVLISSLIGVLIIQGMGVLYVYLNKFPYLKDSNDYIAFYGLLGCFISIMFLFVYFYRRGDQLNND